MVFTNVVGCQIQSVYPEVVGSLIDRQYVNVRITPELVRSPMVASLMWTHTKNVNLTGWAPNHFVPLLPPSHQRQGQARSIQRARRLLPKCPAKLQPTKFRCTICGNREISCAKQGAKDVREHLNTTMHKNNNEQTCAAETNKIDKVTSAEVQVVMALVKHSIALAAADTFSSLFPKIFPDSEIAKCYRAGRTKSTCILNNALKPHFRSALAEGMKSSPFSLADNGSNDNGTQKTSA
ncbi:uncharacterized protein LOC125562948 [Nematostella vectensis]|uniref:uncharacterized protein LOC125562948 n=1 Tax=Nematostella vectensis TaxID=45351 RepID=UPI00207733DC|nr:uncharacterized protein LOC125562948 [Nematostella vectensis]